MDFKKFENTYIVRIDKGEELCEKLISLCEAQNIRLGFISGFGAADLIEAGLFDPDEKKFISNTYEGVYEITSLLGTITKKDEKPYLHIHVNFSDRDNVTRGGHLAKANISLTAELMITPLEGSVSRSYDPDTSLYLMDFN